MIELNDSELNTADNNGKLGEQWRTDKSGNSNRSRLSTSFLFFMLEKESKIISRIFEKKNSCFALVETRIIKKKKKESRRAFLQYYK